MEMLGRRALWEVGLNYGHGTGHGVGNYFGVHECIIALLIVYFESWVSFYDTDIQSCFDFIVAITLYYFHFFFLILNAKKNHWIHY